MASRRGHLSRKAPNVKLRPQPLIKEKGKQVLHESDDEGALFDSAMDDRGISPDVRAGKKPFAGAIVCFSGITNKKILSDMISDLGATMSSDFTNQTTHLVTDNAGSAKYHCAVERRIPVLKTEWIMKCHEAWQDGNDITMQKTVNQYRLQIFSGLRICISGEQDAKKRKDMASSIQQNGGLYTKDLDRDVTHVIICGETSGMPSFGGNTSAIESEKVMWARRINSERKGKTSQNHAESSKGLIHVIWEEWIWDCLTFEGRWPEAPYDIRQPRPSPKTISHPVSHHLSTPSFQSIYASTPQQPRPAPKSSDSTSLSWMEEDDPEVIAWKRTPAKNGLSMWEEIVRNQMTSSMATSEKGLDRREDMDLSHSTRPTKAPRQGERQDRLQRDSAIPATHNHSVVSRINSSKSIAFSTASSSHTSIENDSEKLDPSRPFRRAASHPNPKTRTREASPLDTAGASSHMEILSSKAGVFRGLRFRILGEADSPLLVQAIRNEAGSVDTSPWPPQEGSTSQVDFIVVRLVSAAPFFSSAPEHIRHQFRTECWIESCIFEERLLDVSENIVFSPLMIQVPIANAEHVRLHFSSHDPSAALFLKRLARTLGMEVSDTLIKGVTTHLVIPVREGKKYEMALKWKIGVVDAGWLKQIAQTGILPGNNSQLSGVGQCDGSSLAGTSLENSLNTQFWRTDDKECNSFQTDTNINQPEAPDGSINHGALRFLRNGLSDREMDLLLGTNDTDELPQRRYRDLPSRKRRKRIGRPMTNPLTSSPASSIASFPPLAPSSPTGEDEWYEFESASSLPLEEPVRKLEESMRVMYEDPQQEEEKRRLLLLFDEDSMIKPS